MRKLPSITRQGFAVRHSLSAYCMSRMRRTFGKTLTERCTPGPAVVPPTAARAFEKNVAMFCSLAVGGRPPTYTLLAWRVAC